MYTLSELSNDGHVYAEKRQLIDAAVKLLEAREGTVAATMDDMLKKNELILERDLVKRNEDGEQVDPVYLPPFYYAEIGVAA